MIIINSIIDESLKWTREINNLKKIFWGVFEKTDVKTGMQNVFSLLSESRSTIFIDKTNLIRSLRLPENDYRFADEFFFRNSSNENYFHFKDFQRYLSRYLNNPLPDDYNNPSNTMQNQVLKMFKSENELFEKTESRKASLRSNFRHEYSYFDFLNSLVLFSFLQFLL